MPDAPVSSPGQPGNALERHPWLTFAVVGVAPALILSGNVLGQGVSLAALFPALAAVLVISAGDLPHPVPGHRQKRLLVAVGVVVVLLAVPLAKTALADPIYAALVSAVPAVLTAWILSGVYSPSAAIRDLVRALASTQAPRRALLLAALAPTLTVALSVLVCSRLPGIDVGPPRASSAGLLAAWIVTGVFSSALAALAWYGFVAHRLLGRLNPVAVGLALGAVQWFLVWGPTLRPATLADPFYFSRLAASLAVAVVGVWVYRRSAGSLLPVWLMGALLVAARGLAVLMVTPVVVARGDTLDEVFGAAVVAVALVVIVADHMWRRPPAAKAAASAPGSAA